MDAIAGRAAYQQVAEAIKADIRSGHLRPGQQLPSNRALSKQYEVALGTAQKALKMLEDSDWVTATPAVGVFVATTPGRDEPSTTQALVGRIERLQDALESLRERVHRLEERDR
ncbi:MULTISPECIES: GntR family transcriptional regulator [unclassified Pseudonocardia]|uniref:GntR family transcriptional regulator n=1 Tax=unclassified Pseudonocardia TaxID=2619320 RepID=UPI001CF6925E|nr:MULTISPECIES: winged helix-turn-helix domain-containing protein [unclassified Pseudonocardia]